LLAGLVPPRWYGGRGARTPLRKVKVTLWDPERRLPSQQRHLSVVRSGVTRPLAPVLQEGLPRVCAKLHNGPGVKAT
jgi:hypothetical protein